MSRNRKKKNKKIESKEELKIIDFDADEEVISSNQEKSDSLDSNDSDSKKKDSGKKDSEKKNSEIKASDKKDSDIKNSDKKDLDKKESSNKASDKDVSDKKNTDKEALDTKASENNTSENKASDKQESDIKASDIKALETKESDKINSDKKNSDKKDSNKDNSNSNKEESNDKKSDDTKSEDKASEDKTKEDESLETLEKKPKSKVLKFVGRFFAFVGVTLLMLVIGLYVIMWICTKGPSSQIKELFVLSVRESSAGGFLADIYLSPEEITLIEEKNKVEEVTSVTDTSIVQITAKTSDSASDNTIEQEVEEGFIVESMFDVNVYTENGIEFHEIAGTTFTGIAMVVSDPSRVFIGTPRDTYDGGPGISVPDIANRYGAIAATNGGFFVDTGGHGDGGTPIGAVFSHGKMVYGAAGGYYNMMGFNEEGVLICGNMSGQQAIDMGMRDGLQCNPFLIINGEPVNVGGKGGGLNPRTALGQRADGAVVLLTIDGRQASSLGASMSDMVDVMLSFDVVNAGNLDGGGSTVLYYDGEIRNVVMSIYGARGVPNAVCVAPN